MNKLNIACLMILVLAGSLGVIGCGGASRADRIQHLKDSGKVTAGTAYRLEKGETWIGMSKDELYAALGMPTHTGSDETAAGVEERWGYQWDSSRPMVTYTMQNGVVTKISR